MNPTSVLITGGAGFVGSALALRLKRSNPSCHVVALDNLKRRGSELNLARLGEAGIEFEHGDIRNPEDLVFREEPQLILECSAEPSVLAGLDSSPDYVVRTNLVGTLNLLECCRRSGAAMLFLSTSRVYPIDPLCALRFEETETRFELSTEQALAGVSADGITENFPLDGHRSFYGATKLASELFIQEYAQAYGLPALINRCGVLAGPWQMGKIDQGLVAFWVARSVFGGALRYNGFGGSGKQVRDLLHIEDLCDLVELQIADFDNLKGGLFNVGGGRAVSTSLVELTELCDRLSGKPIPIQPGAPRAADIPLYLTDTSKLRATLPWAPKHSVEDIVGETYRWMDEHRDLLGGVLGAG